MGGKIGMFFGEFPRRSFQWKTLNKKDSAMWLLWPFLCGCVLEFVTAVYRSTPDGVSIRDPSAPHLSTTACVYIYCASVCGVGVSRGDPQEKPLLYFCQLSEKETEEVSYFTSEFDTALKASLLSKPQWSLMALLLTGVCECLSMRFYLLPFPGYHQATLNVFNMTFVCPDWYVFL